MENQATGEVVHLRKFGNQNGTLCGKDGFILGIATDNMRRSDVTTGQLMPGYRRCPKCIELLPE